MPALVLGRDLVVGRTHQELTFLLTKKLVGLRADHFLLWPQLIPTLGELEVVMAAAIKLVQPKFVESPAADHAAVRKYLSYLTKMLPPAQVEAIGAAVAPMLAGGTVPDLARLAAWSGRADQIANRAGLIACGDIVAAAREVVREARASHTRPEGRILDLVRWGVSADYLELRSRLGLAMVVAGADGASVAHSFSELGGLFDRGLVGRN